MSKSTAAALNKPTLYTFSDALRHMRTGLVARRASQDRRYYLRHLYYHFNKNAPTVLGVNGIPYVPNIGEILVIVDVRESIDVCTLWDCFQVDVLARDWELHHSPPSVYHAERAKEWLS